MVSKIGLLYYKWHNKKLKRERGKRRLFKISGLGRYITSLLLITRAHAPLTLTLAELKMCMSYYIASDSEIPLLPWDEISPSLFVQELQPEVDSSIANHFSKSYVRYVGSHEGCGCGFRCGKDWWFDDKDDEQDVDELRDAAARQNDHVQFRDYLVEHCVGQQQIEIYGCWEGDWQEKSLGKIQISVDEIADHRFCFLEKYLYVVDMKKNNR